MSDIAIQVDKLGKCFEIGELVTFKKAMRKLARPLGLAHKVEPNLFWALKDVSFELKRGEVLGVIGRNGAGKSTLLKLLSRITAPSAGKAVINGRVGSLLEVGTGFHPELTGRENVYLNGAILGMKKREIDAKFDEIVAFAETEKFIDTPVKRYSSGMRVRLAFAVAAHLEPEILICDEVLAVGDAAFQDRCLGKMGEIATTGRTVLLVSHNMASIYNLCRRAILLSNGRIHTDGESSVVVDEYLKPPLPEKSSRDYLAKDIGGIVTLKSLFTQNEADSAISTPITGKSVDFLIDLEFKVPVQRVRIALGLENKKVGRISLLESNAFGNLINFSKGRHLVKCTIKRFAINPGEYFINFFLATDEKILINESSVLKFQVLWGGYSGKLKAPHRVWGGVCCLEENWSIKS